MGRSAPIRLTWAAMELASAEHWAFYRGTESSREAVKSNIKLKHPEKLLLG